MDCKFTSGNFTDYQDCVNSANGDPVQVQNCENTYFQWVHHDEVIFIRDASDAVGECLLNCVSGVSRSDGA
jgi:hypothetical protein